MSANSESVGRVSPLHATVAAEIRGLDLSRLPDPPDRDLIMETWSNYPVLIFPGQALSEEALVAFSRHFGDLAVLVESDIRSTRHPEILRVANVDEDGSLLDSDHPTRRYFRRLTEMWHTDGSYKDIPSLASLLYALEIPPEGGETCFADGVSAYEQLPDELKTRVAGRHMVHAYSNTRLIVDGLPPLTAEQLTDVPPVTHPVVRRHEDGRQSLYLSENMARYVGGMPLDEGRALHRELVDWATQPRFVYCHAWHRHDLVLWDNRRVMHRVRPFDDKRYRRVMIRTEVKGTEAPRG